MEHEITERSQVNVLGVGVDVLNLDSAEKKCFNAVLTAGKQGYVTITGVHGVMESQRDSELKTIHNRSFLTTPDGMPMVWLGQWDGHEDMDRVYGPDLMLKLCKGGLEHDFKHFFFGGSPEVLGPLRSNLEERYPGIRISKVESPPFRELTDLELEELAQELHELKPHFFWVGLGTPKQERFMARFLEMNPNLAENWGHGFLMLGVGAAFDFHSYTVKQAPVWIQRKGLEWLYRLCVEPRRLWKRYSINNSMFLIKILPAMMGLKKYEIER